MTFLQDPKMGLYHGDSSLYSGRRGLYAGPKFRSGAFELTLPGLRAWWSPRDAGTVTLTGTPTDDVSRIDDKSGNGHHMVQTVAAQRPQYPAAMMGGIDGVEAVNADEHLENATIVTGSSQTVAFVFQPAVDSNDSIIGTGAANSTDHGFRLQMAAADNSFLLRISDGLGQDFINNTTSPLLTWAVDVVHIIQITWTGASISLRCNGTVATKAGTRDPGRMGNFAYGAGAADDFGSALQGFKGDCVVCDALTTDEQIDLEAHWAATYGVTI